MNRHKCLDWVKDVPGDLEKEAETIVMPVEAVRFWCYQDDSLYSLSMQDVLWPKYERAEAQCYCDKTPSFKPCKGGLYAYRSFRDLIADNLSYLTWLMFSMGPLVLGTVSLWGNIISCEYGYRAQYGYPSGFYNVGGANLKTLSQNYGVPILNSPFTKVETEILHKYYQGRVDGIKFSDDGMQEIVDHERLEYRMRHPWEFEQE
jgi:hypothetical protein